MDRSFSHCLHVTSELLRVLSVSHHGSHLLGVCALSDCSACSFNSGVTELLVIKCADCLVTGMSLLLSTLSKYDWASFFLMGVVRMDLPRGCEDLISSQKCSEYVRAWNTEKSVNSCYFLD